jgi:hypothetical protein
MWTTSLGLSVNFVECGEQIRLIQKQRALCGMQQYLSLHATQLMPLAAKV